MATTIAPKTNGASVKAPLPSLWETFFQGDFFAPFMPMRRGMFGSLIDPFTFPGLGLQLMGPPVDIYEKEGVYTLEFLVPGYKKEHLTTEVVGDTVTIRGAYAYPQSDETARYHKREVRRGTFTRSVTLPMDIDPEKVTATLEDGVLKIVLQPKYKVQAKTIPIKD